MVRRLALIALLAGFVQPVAAAGEVSLWEQLALAREDNEQASQIEILRRLVEAGEGSDEVKADLVRLWVQSGDLAMAEATLESMHAPSAEWLAIVRAGRAFHENQQPEEAVQGLRAFLAGNPESMAATEALVEMLGQLDRPEETLRVLEASPLTPQNAGLIVARAAARRAIGDLQGALADWNAASRIDERHPAVRAQAAAFERLAGVMEPIEAALAAANANPGDLEAGVLKVFWMREGGMPAKEAAGALLTHFPRATSARVIQAVCAGLSPWDTLEKFAVRTSPSPDAATLRGLAKLDLAVESNTPGARIDRAQYLNESMGQYELAMEDIQAVLRDDPSNARALAAGVYSRTQVGNTGGALSAWRRLEECRPPRPVAARAARQMAQMFFDKGDFPAALGMATRSLELEKAADTLRLRAAIYQRLGQADDAARDLSAAERRGGS